MKNINENILLKINKIFIEQVKNKEIYYFDRKKINKKMNWYEINVFY